jgi:hypothetical protein
MTDPHDDHPMSEGQKRKVWLLACNERLPCRVEDLRVGDHHEVEGLQGTLVLTHRASKGPDGRWCALAVTFDEYVQYRAGEIRLTRNGQPFDLDAAIAADAPTKEA